MAAELAAGGFDLRNGEFFGYVGEHMPDWLDCLDTLGSRPVGRRAAATED
jgi:hypothetical protein